MSQEHIERIIENVKADEDSVGKLSTGEQIIAAFLFNRMDWLPPQYRHPLDALDRLGAEWTRQIIVHHQTNPGP